MVPTNKRLTARPVESADGETRVLIERWGTMHAVRSALGVASAAAYLFLASTS